MQTLIFYDDFIQTPVNPIVSSGDPEANYTIWTTVSPITAEEGAVLKEEYVSEDGMIK